MGFGVFLACKNEFIDVVVWLIDWNFMVLCPWNIFPFFGNRLDVSESGLAALVRLSSGDMRKALNILQVWCLLYICCLFVYFIFKFLRNLNGMLRSGLL